MGKFIRGSTFLKLADLLKSLKAGTDFENIGEKMSENAFLFRRYELPKFS